ncbi:MAG: nucleoside 2-deoxyribosyltransferase [Candidatus Limimorpha sp.]
MKKVYFAGSIRGGRADAALYGRLVKYIQRTAIVLTEHVGCSDINILEQGRKDEVIYNQDVTWLRECDVLIAECSCASLGVGYELAYAERYGKECHVFYDKRKTQLSAMLTGNPYFHIYPYEDENDIFPVIDLILK